MSDKPNSFTLSPGHLTLKEISRLREKGLKISLAEDSWKAVERSAQVVADSLEAGKVTYGINTGFGILARERIPTEQVCELQRRLVLSHSAGVGAPLDDAIVRLILALKINSLARGFSGVRPVVLENLIALYNNDLLPIIPEKGSVGASGDLAPLAHMSAVLLGEGEVTHKGERITAGEGLARIGLEPLPLAAKEGLALLNGTQVSTALAAQGLFEALDLFAGAIVAGALSLDAAKGSPTPFDARIHEVRGQPGQIAVAALLREMTEGSEIRQSHIDCSRVQDPYSLRCQPQVMGAALDSMGHATGVIEREANAVSDNPVVFSAEEEVLSGGNFHAEPVAMASDILAVAIAEIGALSERRIALLTDANMSELPAFLVAQPGLNSGFMIAHVTAAALASENKSLAFPTSVDSLPTSANQEDHVSMATHGARRLLTMAENSRNIVAIELLAAAQGVDFRRPMKSSALLERAMKEIRKHVAFRQDDSSFTPDIAAMEALTKKSYWRNLISRCTVKTLMTNIA